jgi:hypothetical protein
MGIPSPFYTLFTRVIGVTHFRASGLLYSQRDYRIAQSIVLWTNHPQYPPS